MQSVYGKRTLKEKLQLPKLEDVGLSCTGLENGHLRIAMGAMQQTLYRYGVVSMGRRGQAGATLSPMLEGPNTTRTTKLILLV